MKKAKFWQFAVIIVLGFAIGAVGINWFIDNASEDAMSNLPVSIAGRISDCLISKEMCSPPRKLFTMVTSLS